MLNYKNDPWLLNKKITINDLIKNKKYHLIFLDKEKNILNLFSAFVKRDDFIKRDKINQPLQKTVYVKISKKLTQILDNRFPDKKDLIKVLEEYSCRRSNLRNAVSRWFEKKIFPLILLRIISKNKKEFSQFLEEAEYFTDFLNKSMFYCPKTLDNLLDKRIVYLVGCSLGDGHLDKPGKRWTLVDGHSKKEKLRFSGMFISNLSTLVQNFTNKPNIKGHKTKWVINVNNKIFCRFLSFFWGLPFGKKKYVTLKKPLILNLSYNDLEKYFWRGYFDTDGGVNKQGAVGLCSSDNNIMKECEKYLKSIGIQPKERRYEVIVRIPSLKKFKKIGFAHPRKQKEFLDILKRGSKYINVKLKPNIKISHKLLKIYKIIRIDDNYRIRIHSRNLKESKLNKDQVKHIIEELFGYEFKKTTKNLLYFKSKKVYQYLNENLIFEPYWKPIKRDEELYLLNQWNDVWNEK